ncbi:MAG: hypothetical protein ACRYGF_04925 [Janthinobacterium lividum]
MHQTASFSHVVGTGTATARLQQANSDWFREFHWHFYATLTFWWEIGRTHARVKLEEYLSAIEEDAKAPLACLIAEETKVSGVGQAAGRVHFHMLGWCAKAVAPGALELLWEQRPFGGNRTFGKSGLLKVYDVQNSAVHYLFKDLPVEGFEWSGRNLDLNAREHPRSYSTSTRQRRRLRRNQARSGEVGMLNVPKILGRLRHPKPAIGALQEFPASPAKPIVVTSRT